MLEFLNNWLPEIAVEHGLRLDEMLAYVHWLMLVLFVGWGAYFIYVLFRFRESKSPVVNYKGTSGKSAKYSEVAVIIAEASLLVGFAIPLWAERVNEFPAKDDAIVVRVVAEQFAWNMHYPGPDGVFGKTDIKLIDAQSNPLGLDRSDPLALDDITNVNQLHLPVDKSALLLLSSKDVIHSFGVPEFRVKQDAIPGERIPIWFKPTVTTSKMREIKGDEKFNYEIACAQLCGIGHTRMRGFVTIDSAEGFEQWLGEQEPTLGSADEEEAW